MMRYLLLALVSVCLGCSIAPVVTDPGDSAAGRYDDCRRAARDYCRDVVRPDDDAMKKCVSEATYRCMTGGS